MVDYALKIKELRKHLKLTQKKFAEDLGVSRSIISQIEIAKFNPTLEMIEGVARIYCIYCKNCKRAQYYSGNATTKQRKTFKKRKKEKNRSTSSII